MSNTFTTTGLVLKRHNYKETDRVVTLITQPLGKITVIAKGARKLLSSKRGILEPGNVVKMHCFETKNLPILTQAQIISPALTGNTTLDNIKNIQLALELFDRIFVEEELEEEIFESLLTIRDDVIHNQIHRGNIRSKMEELLIKLGFPSLKQSNHVSISDFIAELTHKPIKSWEYLS